MSPLLYQSKRSTANGGNGSILQQAVGRGLPTWVGLIVSALFLGLVLFWHHEITSFNTGVGNKRYVVVYYANETTTDAFSSGPYQSLQRILAESGRDIGADLAEALARDSRDFSASVRYKTAEFLEQARRHKFDLAIFTNEMTRVQQYLFFDADAQHLENSSFVFTSASTHPFVKTAPLAQSAALRQALLDVVNRYPSSPLQVLLIVHSHGTLNMAMMPRVSIDIDHASPQEIIGALDSGAKAPPPTWARVQGTTKTEFWQVLRDVGIAYSNVYFPLVVRASCESGLGSWQEYFGIPNNIGLIAHTGMRNLDLRSQLLDLNIRNAAGHSSLFDLLSSIRRAGFDIDTPNSLAVWLLPLTLWQVPVVVYFLPAIALLIYSCLVGVHNHVYRSLPKI